MIVMENVFDFLSAALPWIAMGLFAGSEIKKKDE